LRMNYIRGLARGQAIMFPATVDEYIEEDNEVRVLAEFLRRVDFEKLGFVRAQAAETGRPGYDPRMLMGLYMWGHLNRVRSSRRLEQECKRNVELMWLCENLRPDHKTIADFRKDNGKAIKNVTVTFRLWCQDAGLFGNELVTIDGSKFKAVNSKDRNYGEKKLQKMIASERAKVDEYMQALAESDDADEGAAEKVKLNAEELREKLESVAGFLARHEELQRQLEADAETQISLTDRDARLMKTSKGNEVSYNVQMAVDDKHKLIAEFEVTNDCNDVQQLGPMAQQAKAALQVEELDVVVDAGYFEGNALKQCEDEQITVYVPVPQSKEAKRLGIFELDQFAYEAERDVYICPQNEELTHTFNRRKRNKLYKVYTTRACAQCPLRVQCTTNKQGRQIDRWEHHEVVDRLHERNRSQPAMMKKRMAIAEQPFGTIKSAMNQGYFLLKGIAKVRTETSLTVLAYNMKRVINVLGVREMLSRLQASEIWAS
jgi:transposase